MEVLNGGQAMDVALNPGDYFVDADGNVWLDAAACAGGITGMVLLFTPVGGAAAAALSVGRALAWGSGFLSNGVNIGMGCGSLLSRL